MNERTKLAVAKTHEDLGLCTGPEDVYLGLRGCAASACGLPGISGRRLELARWLARTARGRARDPPGPRLQIPDTRSGSATSPEPPACSRSC